MNRVVAAVAALFLVFLVTVAGLIGYAAVVGPELDASSKAYVDEAVPRIIANWSVDELLSRVIEWRYPTAALSAAPACRREFPRTR